MFIRLLTLGKIEGAIMNVQSKDTGNTGHTRRRQRKQTKTKLQHNTQNLKDGPKQILEVNQGAREW